MKRPDRGTSIVLLGVALIVLTLAGSALLAPAIATPGAGNETVVGIHGGGFGWHKYGSVLALNGSATKWSEDSADSYFEVTRLQNGSILAGFMHDGYENCGEYEPPCARTGFRIIDPAPQPRVVREWSFPVRTEKNSEVHAAKPVPGGGYLVGDMEYERVFILEGGEITWQWNASEFYDAPPDPTKKDWLHLNDVDVISKDRYMVSIRNANQILILERGEGVVEVINEDEQNDNDWSCSPKSQLVDTDGDGEIRCGNPLVLNHQHNPHWLGNGSVLVADSHNDRAVELHRTAAGNWNPVWTIRSAGGIKFDWPRDADRLPNGNTLITDTLKKRIVEVNESGHVVWSYNTKYLPYEADRVPFAESSPVPLYNGNISDPVEEPPDDVPVLSTMLLGLKAVWSGVPYWFNETQLFLVLVGVGTVFTGGVVRWRSE